MPGKIFKSAAASLLMITVALVALWVIGPIAVIEPYMNYLLDGRMLSVGLVIFIILMGILLYKDHAASRRSAHRRR